MPTEKQLAGGEAGWRKPRARRKAERQPGGGSELSISETRSLLEIELAELKSIPPGDTSGEIGMLRVVMRRLLAYADTGPEYSEAKLQHMCLVLNHLCKGCAQLARLMRVQKELASIQDPWPEELRQALDEARRELNLV